MRIRHLESHIPVLFSVVRAKEEARLERLSRNLSEKTAELLHRSYYRLDLLGQRLRSGLKIRLSAEGHRLDMLDQRLHLLDPSLLLERGYSITLYKSETNIFSNIEALAKPLTSQMQPIKFASQQCLIPHQTPSQSAFYPLTNRRMITHLI